MDVPLVVLQFGLYVGQQGAGVFLTLSDQNHDVNLSYFLTFEPQRYENIQMGGLGRTTMPLERRFQVAFVQHLVRCLDVERRAGRLLSRFVDGVVREIILYESGIIGTHTLDARKPFACRFRSVHNRGLLHCLAVFLPSFYRFL